jgi:hypothetical protein
LSGRDDGSGTGIKGHFEMTECEGPPSEASKYVAKLFGSAGQQGVGEFEKLTDAILWSLAAEMQAAERADIYLNEALVWTKTFSKSDASERVGNEEVEAEQLLAKLAADNR